VALIGLGCAVYALRGYIGGKVKNLADKEDIERLTQITEGVRSTSQKHAVVHCVQFEAEFRHYEKVWDATHKMFKSFVQMNPRVREPILAPKQETFNTFLAAHAAFTEALDASTPFIPTDIWTQPKQFDELMINDKIDKLTGLERENIRECRAEARQALQECAEAIRGRLSKLSVV
jgi:hypothetical protein